MSGRVGWESECGRGWEGVALGDIMTGCVRGVANITTHQHSSSSPPLPPFSFFLFLWSSFRPTSFYFLVSCISSFHLILSLSLSPFSYSSSSSSSSSFSSSFLIILSLPAIHPLSLLCKALYLLRHITFINKHFSSLLLYMTSRLSSFPCRSRSSFRVCRTKDRRERDEGREGGKEEDR